MKAALRVERKRAALKDFDGKAALMAKAFGFFEVEKEVHSPKEKKGYGESRKENNDTLLCFGKRSKGYC